MQKSKKDACDFWLCFYLLRYFKDYVLVSFEFNIVNTKTSNIFQEIRWLLFKMCTNFKEIALEIFWISTSAIYNHIEHTLCRLMLSSHHSVKLGGHIVSIR